MAKRKGLNPVVGKKDILVLLENRQLSVKEIADSLGLPIRSVYRYVNDLVVDGSILKLEKVVEGRSVAIYSLPVVAPGVCQWEAHKEILLAGKTYQKNVLETDFWPLLKQDVSNLRQRQETLDILITGLKGSGKSVTGIWLATGLDRSFSVRGNIVLRKAQLLELAVRQPVNKAFVLDDLGTSLSSRGWRDQEREAVFNFFEICRQNRVHLIGTSPSLDLVDLNFRRLIRYLWDVQLRCKDHVHIIVHRSVSPGLKPNFKPVGVLTLPYPKSIGHLVKEYELVKRQELRGAAQDALERLEKAKAGVRMYINTHSVTRVTDDVVRSALSSIGLDVDLPKRDKDKLRTTMFDALQEKKKAERKAKREQVEQGKENLRKARLLSSYRRKYQEYIDKGRSEDFARTLAYRLTFERTRAGNLKNLPGVVGSLLKKVKSYLVEGLVLRRLDDPYLVRDLRAMRDLLGLFKGFDQSFYSKLFAMFLEDPKQALAFISQAKEMRKSWLCQYHKRFSPKKWREAVLSRLRDLEAKERWKRQRERSIEGTIASAIDIGHLIFGKPNPRVLDYVDQKDRSFWGDV